MKAEIKNGKLLIEIDVQDPPVPSKSGKTLVVASTYGNLTTTVVFGSKPLVIGLNAYIPR